jgi:hypothetical protein
LIGTLPLEFHSISTKTVPDTSKVYIIYENEKITQLPLQVGRGSRITGGPDTGYRRLDYGWGAWSSQDGGCTGRFPFKSLPPPWKASLSAWTFPCSTRPPGPRGLEHPPPVGAPTLEPSRACWTFRRQEASSKHRGTWPGGMRDRQAATRPGPALFPSRRRLVWQARYSAPIRPEAFWYAPADVDQNGSMEHIRYAPAYFDPGAAHAVSPATLALDCTL